MINAIKYCERDNNCKGYSVEDYYSDESKKYNIRIATASSCPGSYSSVGDKQDVGALVTNASSCGMTYKSCFIKQTRKTINNNHFIRIHFKIHLELLYKFYIIFLLGVKQKGCCKSGIKVSTGVALRSDFKTWEHFIGTYTAMKYYNINDRTIYVKSYKECNDNKCSDKKMYLFFGPNPDVEDGKLSWLIYPKLKIPTFASRRVYNVDSSYRLEDTRDMWIYYNGPSRWAMKMNVECL